MQPAARSSPAGTCPPRPAARPPAWPRCSTSPIASLRIEDRGSRIEDKPFDPRSSIFDPQFIGVGVSFNGPVAADGRTVRRSMHIPGWEDSPLAERLERELGAPALIANDADAAALAEQ